MASVRAVVRLLLVVLATAAVPALAGCATEGPRPATVVDVEVPRPVSPAAPVATEEEMPAEMAILGALADVDGALLFSDGERRRVEGAGFHYDVPSAWEELDAATLGSPLIRCSQRNTEAVQGFMTNVNVASEPFVDDGPLYADANLLELRKVATIRDRRPATAGSRPAGDIESHWANPGGVPYVTLQRYVGNGTDGFVITCSVAASAFAAERPVCDRILDSFRVE